ncbi:hypothetical protein L6V77_14780 [Myxococcota bacterium]|nr:hypothetical protein [Myxococcota bacterium]
MWRVLIVCGPALFALGCDGSSATDESGGGGGGSPLGDASHGHAGGEDASADPGTGGVADAGSPDTGPGLDAARPAADAARLPDAVAGADAAAGTDAVAGPDAVVTPDAARPGDAGVPADASPRADAAVSPDAARPADATLEPDATLAPDAFAPLDATVDPDAARAPGTCLPGDRRDCDCADGTVGLETCDVAAAWAGCRCALGPAYPGPCSTESDGSGGRWCTTWTYDDDGRRTSGTTTRDCAGPVVWSETWDWHPGGVLARHEVVGFDLDGRVTSRRSETYDAAGHRTREDGFGGEVTWSIAYQLDADGRPIAAEWIDDTPDRRERQCEAWTWDAEGGLLEHTMQYDCVGAPFWSESAELAYDAAGRPVSQRWDGCYADEMGTAVYRDRGERFYTYDAAGRLSTRIETIDVGCNGPPDPQQTETWRYDPGATVRTTDRDGDADVDVVAVVRHGPRGEVMTATTSPEGCRRDVVDADGTAVLLRDDPGCDGVAVGLMVRIIGPDGRVYRHEADRDGDGTLEVADTWTWDARGNLLSSHAFGRDEQHDYGCWPE